VTVKKDLLNKVGLFDTTFPTAQDYDLWLRLSMIPDIKIRFIDEPLGFYVTRDGNISSNIEQRLYCKLRISRKHVEYLKKTIRFRNLERLKFEGKAYALSGIAISKQGNLIKGIICFFKGIIKWPFRLDWIYKLIKKAL